jgi:hypothetical protein
MTSWIQKGFSFQTNKAAYRCNYEGFEVGAEKWVVDIRYVSSEKQTGRFELPANWARTMVFQFLNGLDEGQQSTVDYQEQQLIALRAQLQEATNKILAYEHAAAATPLEGREGAGEKGGQGE